MCVDMQRAEPRPGWWNEGDSSVATSRAMLDSELEAMDAWSAPSALALAWHVLRMTTSC